MSESNPMELVVAAFRDERGADDAMETLVEAKKEHLVKIKEAAIVRCDTKNKLHISERGDIGVGGGAASGAVIGAVVGLFGGPIGALIGGAAGAAIGGLAAKLIDTGIPDDRLRQIGASLKPGSSAIVALIEYTAAEDLRADLAQAGGDILTQAISEDTAAQLAADRDVAYSVLTTGGGVIAGRVAENEQNIEAESIASSAEGTVTAAVDGVRDTADNAVSATDAVADTAGQAREVTGSAAAQVEQAADRAIDAASTASSDAAAAVQSAAKDAADTFGKQSGDKS